MTRTLIVGALFVLAMRPVSVHVCEPVVRPLRQADQVVFLAVPTVRVNGDLNATVIADRWTVGSVTPGPAVLVPWSFGPDCKPVPWNTNTGAQWSPPTTPAVYSGILRPGGRSTSGPHVIDLYMANLQPLWSDDEAARGRYPGASGFLSPREFLEFYSQLPTDLEFDRRQAGALDRINRWESDHPALSQVEPARSMLASLRWLWERNVPTARVATIPRTTSR